MNNDHTSHDTLGVQGLHFPSPSYGGQINSNGPSPNDDSLNDSDTRVQFADRSPSIIPTPVYTDTSSMISTPSVLPSPAMPLRIAVSRHADAESSTMTPTNFGSDTFRAMPARPWTEKTAAEDMYGPRFSEQDEDVELQPQRSMETRNVHRAEFHDQSHLGAPNQTRSDGFMRINSNTDASNAPPYVASSQTEPLMAGVPLPYGHKRRLPMRILLGPYKRPWFSWLSGAVMLIVLVVELVKNSSMTGSVIETSPFNVMIGPSFQVLINMGARYTPCMRPLPGYSPSTSVTDCYRDGETCTLEQLCGFGGFGGGEPNQSLRFFAPIFLHAGVIHYLMNMLTHLRLGADLECALGAPRYILLYLASGIWGFVLSAMLSPKNTASMGCSGALFGLIGYMFIDVIVNWRIIPNPMRELVKLLLATIISLVLGLLPGLDNFAHIGGFAVGIVMGMLVAPMRPSASKRAKWVTWGLRACALVILIIMFAVGINSFYSSPDPSQICPGCKYLSCLPVSNWCDNY